MAERQESAPEEAAVEGLEPTPAVRRPLNPDDRLSNIVAQKGNFDNAFGLISVRQLTRKEQKLVGSEHGGMIRAITQSPGPVIQSKDVTEAHSEIEEEDKYKPFAGELDPVARVRAEYRKLASGFDARKLDPKNLVEWLQDHTSLQSMVSGTGTEARTELAGKISNQALLELAIEEKKRVLLLASVIQAAHSTGEPLRRFVKGLPGIEYTHDKIVKPSRHDKQKSE